MSGPNDVYWDDLGVAWRAVNPDPNAIAPRLGRRLRWQGLCFRAMAFVGFPLSLAGLALGAWTIRIGWTGGAWNFVTRGIAIIVISLLLALGAWSLRAGVHADSSSLAGMIDLAIRRAERALAVIRLGYWACGVAAAFGLVGYAIRVQLGRPPALSPIVPLVVLALTAAALLLYGRRLADALARLRHLEHALGEPG